MSEKPTNEQLKARIEGFLRELCWPFEEVGPQVLRTHYEGFLGELRVMMHIHEEGVMMAIDPVVAKPEGGWGLSVSRLLNSLAHDVRMIRVGLDKEGDIFLRVDVGAEDCNFEQFSYVLFNLCQVSERLQVPILQANVYDAFIREEHGQRA